MCAGLMIAVSSRPLTLLAKEPIFRIPLLGALVRALGALPVVRAQDDPARLRENAEAQVRAGSTRQTFETGLARTVRWYLENAEWVAQVKSGEYRQWVETNYAKRVSA